MQKGLFQTSILDVSEAEIMIKNKQGRGLHLLFGV